MTTRIARLLIAAAALLMAVATGLGAWAAHGLDSVLDAAALRSFTTAVDYQFVHSLGVLAVAMLGDRHAEPKTLAAAAALLLAGIVLFCGGLYASSFDGPGWISSLAPAGGIGLITGWIAVAIAVIRGRPQESAP